MPNYSIIYQGEDKDVTFTLKDNNGNPINLANTYTGIICVLSQDDGKVLERYSREAYTYNGVAFNTADFEQLNQVSNTGKFTLHIQRDVTRSATIGAKLQFEIKVQNTDSEHDDNIFTTVAVITRDNENEPFEVRYSYTKNNEGFA